MADVNANIDVNINTSEALAQLKSLQRQISQFHTSVAKSSESAAIAQKSLQRNLLNSINSIGAFSAEFRNVQTTAESFTTSLEGNKFSMREYFRYAAASTKTFGKVFKTEFDTIGKVAEERVKKLQTQYIKLGRDSSGAMKSIAVMPTQLNMQDYGTKTQIAAQKQALFNQLVKQGSTNLLNFGKNTQWAGRQLMVGFTLPLMALGSTSSKVFMDMEAQALKFKKVYGDLFTPQEETQAALDNVKALANQFTQYGVAASATVGLAADAAAAGFQGADLTAQTTQATRLSVLGQIDQQKALETTIALQNAFKTSAADLADSINFLNAVENQTVVSLDDITTAIPKVAPVIMQLGGDVKDLAFFLTAMKEGGINASEGANALKSGLASLINPTKQASAMLSGFGINIRDIVTKNKGDLKTTVVDFANALNQLDPLNRAQAIEKMFGKFQFARLSALFANVASTGTQAARVLDLATASTSDLAATAEKELGITAESSMMKFKKAVEDLKVTLIPVGQAFLEAATPIVEFVGNILEKFNNLGSGTKKAIATIVAVVGGLGPVLLMTFGLLANGVANIIKLFITLRGGFLKLTGQSQILGEQTQYLTMEQLDAAAAAHSLDQSHAQLTQTFTAESTAVGQLVAAYQQATAAAAKFAAANPGMMLPPRTGGKKFADGGLITGPGSGTSDSIPIMASNGEAVIPAKSVKKYPQLTAGLIAGNIPGFRKGGIVGSDFAHITGREQSTIGAVLASLESLPEEVQKSRSALISLVRDLVDTFGAQLKTFKYSGLGFTQSSELNRGMAGDNPVSASKFLEDFTAQGSQKWTTALDYAGVKLDDVGDELDVYDQRLADSVKSIIDLDSNATITSSQFAEIEKAVRLTLPEFSQLREALNLAEATMTEFRYNINQSDVQSAGLTSFQVPSSKDPSKMSAKRKVKTRGGREVRLGGDHQLINVAGAFDVDETIQQIKRDAGTASPSKKTIPIGEDIARGLEVGMANRQDDVERQGSNLSNAAITGTKKRRFASSNGVVTPGKPYSDVAANIGPSPEVLDAGKKKAVEEGIAAQRLGKMNAAIMSGTFAMTSLAGVGSMFGGTIGNLSQQVFKFSGLLFGLMSITQLLTQAKIAALAAERLSIASGAMKMAKGGGGIAGMAGILGKSGPLGNLARVGFGITKFLGPIGLATTALTGLYLGFKLIKNQQERTRKSIEGLGDAATLSSDKLKTLGNFFGVAETKSPLELAKPSLTVAPQQRTQLEELKASADFQGTFKDTIASLKTATNKQAELVFKSLNVQLKGKGYSEEQITTIIQALQEEAGKTDVKIDVKSLDLTSAGGMKTFGKDISTMINSFSNQFAKGYTATVTYGTNWQTGEAVKVVNEQLSKGLKKSLSTTSKELGGILTGLSGQLANGTLNAEQFNAAFGSISEKIKGMPEPQAMFLMDNLLKSLPSELAQSAAGIKNVSDQLLIAKAAALGLTTITPAMIAALKAAGEVGADPRAGLAAGRVRAKINKDMTAIQKVIAETIKSFQDFQDVGGGEKSAFQLAVEQLTKSTGDLNNTQTAYKKLTDAGFDAGKAMEIAKDSTLAAALATTKVGTGNWKKLVELLKKYGVALSKDALSPLAVFNSKQDESTKNSVAQQSAFIKLINAGVNAGTAFDMVANAEDAATINGEKNNKNLTVSAEKFTASQAAAKRYSEALALVAEHAKLVADTSPEGQVAVFKKGYDEAMKYFDAQGALIEQQREGNPEYKAITDQIDAQTKAMKDAQDIIDGYQESINKFQYDLDTNTKYGQTVIDNLNSQIDTIQRGIETNFDRPLQALSNESDILSNTLSLIDRQEQSINAKYDLQAEALTKISAINTEIANQQKQQLGLADALSKGDISAAASAAQEMRSSAAQAAVGNATGMLDAARKAEIGSITVNGMTRAEIEERQFQISQQQFQLTEARKLKEAEILVLQDKLYAIDLLRKPVQKDIADLEFKISEQKRLQLDPAQKALDKANEAKDAYQKQTDNLVSQIKYIGQTKDAWVEANVELDAAETSGTNLEGALKNAEGYVKGITDKWAALDSKTITLTVNEIRNITEVVTQKKSDQSSGGGKMYGGWIKKMALGGYVPGSGMTDKVHTLLTPGEFVVNKSAASKLGPMLSALNESKYPGMKNSGYRNVSPVNASSSVNNSSSAVYNYSVGISVNGSNSSPDDIARAVMTQIKNVDSQRIRKQSV